MFDNVLLCLDFYITHTVFSYFGSSKIQNKKGKVNSWSYLMVKEASWLALESPPIHSLYSPFSCPQVMSLRVKERSSGERVKETLRLSPALIRILLKPFNSLTGRVTLPFISRT